MERFVAGRIGIGRQGYVVVRTWIGGGVFDTGGAVRKLCVAVHRAAGGASRFAGSDWVTGFAWVAERCVLPDRVGDVDRAIEQKRDFDRGVCGAVAGAGAVDC